MPSRKPVGIALVVLGLICLVASAGGAHDVSAAGDVQPAENEWEETKDWSIEFTPYLFVANINGDTGVPGNTVPVGVGIIDILKHLQGLAMFDGTAHYRRFGVLVDGSWFKVGASKSLSGPLFTRAKNNISAGFGTGALTYRFRPKPGLTVDPYVGARWWRLHPEIRLSGGVAPSFETDPVETWADFVVGARLRYDITDTWYLRALGDVGGGVSKVQWQGFIGGGYSFKDWFGLEVGYRSIGVDYDHNGFIFDVIVHGIQFGFNFRM